MTHYVNFVKFDKDGEALYQGIGTSRRRKRFVRLDNARTFTRVCDAKNSINQHEIDAKVVEVKLTVVDSFPSVKDLYL